MDCPQCKTTNLVVSERQGVEIDYCPQCRGVWLDRGELDKIVERSAAYEAAAVAAGAPRQAGPAHPQPPLPPQAYPPHAYGHDPRKRKSFWSELFD
jgi:hypothetical protein